MKRFAVVVAGGKGERMGSELPKQFIELGGLPILIHTIRAFKESFSDIEIILVLPPHQIDAWSKICEDFKFTESLQIAKGGPTRFQSVKNGLDFVPEDSLVAVHDGVRPFVTPNLIEGCFTIALQKGSAIPTIPLNDSIREIIGEDSVSRNRQNYRLVQTPQCFQSSLLKRAYENAESDASTEFTDDASVMEWAGNRIYLANGDVRNIKITNPSDLVIAEAIHGSMSNTQRQER